MDDYKTKSDLILPFKGEWVIGNGGRTPEKNGHRGPDDNGPISQRYAYDFARGHKGKGEKLDDYEAFGEEVIAPGDGVIALVINGSKDVPIGEKDRYVIPGNSVVIDHQNGEFSLLAHFKYDSIKVNEGDKVSQGDVLGLCGNTGNTTEPHIHYHLQDTPFQYSGKGLPIQFRKILVDGVLKEDFEPEHPQKVSNPK